jgi:hypothetical protein
MAARRVKTLCCLPNAFSQPLPREYYAPEKQVDWFGNRCHVLCIEEHYLCDVEIS